MNHNDVLERVYDAYCRWYDMERGGGEKTPLFACGHFHERDTGFFLTERATMWRADSNDHLYIFNLPSLGLDDFNECTAFAKENGERYIKPDKNHRSSYITALFICEDAEADALRALSRYRFRKDFSFGFQGWEEVHTVLVTTADGQVVSNRDGMNSAKFLNQMLNPRKKSFFKRK